MTSTISDFFSSAPATSQLHAPLEVQRADDFDSTVTRPVNSQPLVGWCLSHGWLQLIHSTTTNAWLKRIDPTNGCWLNEWLISQRANL
jgi:hypothetical protein